MKPSSVKSVETLTDNYRTLFYLIFLGGIICSIAFCAIGYRYGYQDGQLSQNTTIDSEKAKILDSQKAIISQIMDYQIKHGSNTIQWGVNVNFVGGENDV
jgi:hypothetical protein